MTYGRSTNTSKNKATNDNNIDALLAGRRWQSNTVTFSFTTNFRNDYEDESGYANSNAHASSFSRLNQTQRDIAREWMDMYEAVSNLNLVELSGFSDRHATIRMAESDYPNTAYAYYPWNSFEAGDIWFNPQDYNEPKTGNYAYHTFGHEIGHALGLEHGHEGEGIRGVAMNSNRDSMEFSIMTYRSYVGDPLSGGYSNEKWGYAQSLMMYDIRTIQEMYGANFTHNSSNTTYSFSTQTGEMFVNGVGQGKPGGNNIFRTIWDGNGIDTYDFSNYRTNLSINLNPGAWSDLDQGGDHQRANLGDDNSARGHVFNALLYKGDRRSLIENAHGGTGDDRLHGNSASNYLWGNSGHDRLYGYSGNDILSGSSGNDVIYGGVGRDRIYGGSGNDWINGGSGQDYHNGGSGIDTIDYTHFNGGGTYNLLNGTVSAIYVEYIRNFENINTGNGNDRVYGTNGANRISASAGNDRIYAHSGNDTVYGGSGDDYLSGSSGNDILKGDSGRDRIYGSSGNDWINGGSGQDYHDGGTGTDTIDYTHFNGGGTYNLTTEIVSAPGSNYTEWIRNFENINTGNGHDRIIGTTKANRIHAGAGNDSIYAGGGSDTVYGKSGNDYLSGRSGKDRLYGGLGRDRLYGGAGDDLVAGGSGHDYLTGSYGNDILQGGKGNDTLLGGSGADRFVFSRLNGGIDTIADFVKGQGDKLQILASGFGGGLKAGLLDTSQFALGSVATKVSDRFIYNRNTGSLAFDVDGSGSQAAVQFATLSMGLNLTSSDFLLV